MGIYKLFKQPKRLQTWPLYILTVSFLCVAFSNQLLVSELPVHFEPEAIIFWFKHHELTGNILLGLSSYAAILLALESYIATQLAAKESGESLQNMIHSNLLVEERIKNLLNLVNSQYRSELRERIRSICIKHKVLGDETMEIVDWIISKKDKIESFIVSYGSVIDSRIKVNELIVVLEVKFFFTYRSVTIYPKRHNLEKIYRDKIVAIIEEIFHLGHTKPIFVEELEKIRFPRRS